MTSKEKQIIIEIYTQYQRAMLRYIKADNNNDAVEASHCLAVIGDIMDSLKIDRPKLDKPLR